MPTSLSGREGATVLFSGHLYHVQDAWGYIDCQTGNIRFNSEPFYALYLGEWKWYGLTMHRAWSLKSCGFVLFYVDRPITWVELDGLT